MASPSTPPRRPRPSPPRLATRCAAELFEPSGAFRSFADAVREQLDPVGPLETVLANRAIAAAWRIDGDASHPFTRQSQSAERSLTRMIFLLDRLRDHRQNSAPGPDVPEAENHAWRGRLDHDPALSETSPIVRGTWVTVDQVIALIVDGWTWKDILRSHPELTEDDLRACLSYSVEK